MLSYLTHRRNCKEKQASRASAIASLPAVYHEPLTLPDITILTTPVSITSSLVRKGDWKPIEILHAYGKRTLQAHAQTNCITEVLIPKAEEWLAHSTASGRDTDAGVNLSGPLAGIPVSLKDTANVAGYDSCIGYSKYTKRPAREDAPLIRLLRDAGAVPFVKTNIPITLLSFESTNPVFGRASNPHNARYSPGGSTGGEAALLAFGGSRIGVGTDVAGSVRVPAHYCGIYALRCSTGRFPRSGCMSAMAGQEGVPAVYSPMAKTMPDLSYFLGAVIGMEPWKYDHTVHPLPWQPFLPDRPMRWGVMRSDDVVPPSPACARALETAIAALKSQGEQITELDNVPNNLTSLRVAAHLLNADGGTTYTSHFTSAFEANDPGVAQMRFYFRLPRLVKRLYCAYVRYIRRDAKWADCLSGWHARSAEEQWKLVIERENIKKAWFDYWEEQDLDFVLTVPNALPAVPEGGMKRGFASCGYTFLWNLVDYASGVLPVTKVDAVKDALPSGFLKSLDNQIAKNAFVDYDATAMAGLPVGIQVVTKRLEEEKCLWGMQRVVECLGMVGDTYQEIEVKVG
ncbi:acetamidase [Morchella conica CCBAS932]|uniref:amidase n=1 Tax=Morchella conica CCBAS932 TaxID=1392247 RepID=A0A3N4L588_9PEZI|nr:acetamidase [Morchella conica CCBAS932]